MESHTISKGEKAEYLKKPNQDRVYFVIWAAWMKIISQMAEALNRICKMESLMQSGEVMQKKSIMAVV